MVPDNGRWISVDEFLPEEGEYVLVWIDTYFSREGHAQVACIRKGVSMADREKMRRGELEDPIIQFSIRPKTNTPYYRSSAYYECDEHGNNRKPYCWRANGGPMKWFGQDVTHWMPLPEGPVENTKHRDYRMSVGDYIANLKK